MPLPGALQEQDEQDREDHDFELARAPFASSGS